MPFSADSSNPDFLDPGRDTATKSAALEYCQLGGDLIATKKYNPAKAAYQCAIDCDPTLAIAHGGLAIACYHLGEYPAAKVAIDLAIDLSPKGSDFYYQCDLIVQALNRCN